MGDMPIGKLLFRLSPPVMLALLIQSVYNIVDSYFVAQYSLTGLTALSLVFPIQQLATALATIAMQSLYTLYIVGLNLILKQFTEDAVTVLGIYYKLQTFFFIPLMGLQQVIVPVLSFNHSAGAEGRVRETLRWAVGISEAVMAAATAVFLLAPSWRPACRLCGSSASASCPPVLP